MFTLQKIGRNHTQIIETATGELLCTLRNKEVAGWVSRVTKAREEEKIFAAERHVRRVELAKEYLAQRANRASTRQLNLF